jgi:DNA mismatch repair ATPase MutS
MDTFDKKETQRVADTAKTAEEAHYDAIAEVHSDYEEISQEPLLDNWIKTLPALEQAGAAVIKKTGSPEDVIDLLTRFKEANGIKVPANKKATSKLDKAKKEAIPSFRKAKEVNTQKNQTVFTREQIDKMTDKEWAENEPAIDAWMAAGQPTA